MTAVVERPDGSRYELRNCRITSVTEEVCDPHSREIPIIWTRVR